MTLWNRIKEAYIREVSYRIDKVINTLIWLLSSKNDVLVLNVWLKHRGKKVRRINLGDDLNYYIASSLSGKKVISYMHSYIKFFKPINYMCIGSIVDTIGNENSIIWGSGALRGDKIYNYKKPLQVLAVRGPLTRDFLLLHGVSCPEVYGDPALLLPRLYKVDNRETKYKIGVIPHYIDLCNEKILGLNKQFENEIVIINFKQYNSWQDVIKLINQCQVIASSSLHGIIISDAYGIPNVWIKLSDNVKGEGFKFVDYLSSCGRTQSCPIDFTNENINFDKILEAVKDYKKPHFNLDILLDHCPFKENTQL